MAEGDLIVALADQPITVRRRPPEAAGRDPGGHPGRGHRSCEVPPAGAVRRPRRVSQPRCVMTSTAPKEKGELILERDDSSVLSRRCFRYRGGHRGEPQRNPPTTVYTASISTFRSSGSITNGGIR